MYGSFSPGSRSSGAMSSVGGGMSSDDSGSTVRGILCESASAVARISGSLTLCFAPAACALASELGVRDDLGPWGDRDDLGPWGDRDDLGPLGDREEEGPAAGRGAAGAAAAGGGAEGLGGANAGSGF